MLKYKNLIIIGTSHIAERSLKEIESVFKRDHPDIIAVELDHQRLAALLSNQKPNYSLRLIFQLGIKGYLFALIGSWAQQKLGAIVGIKPGSDMIKAIKLAQANQKRIALIDRDVQVTLARLSKAIRWKEKLHFFIDLFIAPFSKKMRINLQSVPEQELIKRLLGTLKKRYPGIYRVLIEERNQFMAIRLKILMENYPDKEILAVIGAGHEEGILAIMKQ